MADERDDMLLTLTAEIVAAHVSSNSVAVSDLPLAIARVHEALAALGQTAEPVVIAQVPAVTVRTSVKPDYLVCLEDGRKMKMLKRHLRTDHQMTPSDYREKWNLPGDYPMVAPNYAQTRRELAVKIGLGRKPNAAKRKAGRKTKVSEG